MQKIETDWLRDHMRSFIVNRGGADLLGVEDKSRAERLVEQAIEFLDAAREKAQSAEFAKCAAEAELNQYSDYMARQIDLILHGVKEQMDRAQFELAAAKQRAIVAAERASEAVAFVRRLESAMHPRPLRASPLLMLTAA